MVGPLLTVHELKMYLGDCERPVRAVDGVSFDIAPGETFALLGESGCGKSMTALSLMRLLPSAGRILNGEVRLDETNLMALPELAMRQIRGGSMAMIFQEPMTSLNPVMTVGDQIAEAVKRPNRSHRSAIKQRVLELMESVGLPEPEQRQHAYPHQLSGGMKQRVMIAQALAGSPKLLIADEPTTALDVTIQAQVLELLRIMQREHGMAILLITHDLGVVAQMADRVAVMYAGQIVEVASRDSFFADPKHPYTQKLFESLPAVEKRGHRLKVIEGAVPDLADQFPGCRFAARCDAVLDRCHAVPPQWHNTQQHRVRCHLYAEPSTAAVRPHEVDSSDTAVPRAQSTDNTISLLRVDGLKVHFPIRKGVFRRTVGHVRAVDGVDLSIAPGETLALVGESGCGKTSVGKSILQLVRPTAGAVRFAGQDLTKLNGRALRARRTDFQLIFQDPLASLDPRMTIGEIMEEGMKALSVGATGLERRELSDQWLTHVGLPTQAKLRYPHEFSGGQRQRLAVARALAVNPKLIVCDEPTSSLDVSVQAQILNLLHSLQQELGVSYLFITHNIAVVSYLAHQVAVMYLGRIVERGPVGDVLNNSQHPYTRALLTAVPLLDGAQKRPVIRLEGDIPSPVKPPSGCHFHPRCPHAMDVCKQTYPKLTQITDAHVTHCHLYDS